MGTDIWCSYWFSFKQYTCSTMNIRTIDLKLLQDGQQSIPTIYECPTTHPMSLAAKNVSPPEIPNTLRIDQFKAVRYPPVSLTIPFGAPFLG